MDSTTQRENVEFTRLSELLTQLKEQRDTFEKMAEDVGIDAPEYTTLSKLSDDCHGAFCEILEIMKKV